jgi:hypothetical protein
MDTTRMERVLNDRGLPGSLDCASRRAKKQRGSTSRAASVGMTENAKPKSTSKGACATSWAGRLEASATVAHLRLETWLKMGLCGGQGLL